MGKLVIRNIGTIASGDIDAPLLQGDTIVIVDGRIAQVGREGDCDTSGAGTIIDAQGTTVIPGLIDSHVHPVFGDYTPRQRTVDFIDSALHGGITTMISAGEVHTPGRPKDVVGIKALAIAAYKSFSNFRPSGVKVHAGAPILEPGMVEEDFAEMAKAGVKLIGEIGLGGVRTPEEAAPMVRWAKKFGMKVTIHTGGPSLPGSHALDADMVIAIDPDVVGHVNGGTTSVSLSDVEKLVNRTDLTLEVVHCGNPKTALHTLNCARQIDGLKRIIIGNDAPSGTGVIPLGILRVISLLSSLSPLSPEEAIALATGNTARVYSLNTSMIRVGYEADLVILDAPVGSVGKDALSALKAGDIPGISMVLIDGEIRIGRSRNTAPASKMAKIVKSDQLSLVSSGH